MRKNIYLDGAANTPVDSKVYKAMKPFLTKGFVGNTAATHDYGIQAGIKLEDFRAKIADLLFVKDNEVYFTSGATEANNWVLTALGMHELSRDCPDEEKKKHLVVSKIEHSSILSTCKFLEQNGFEVTYVAPNKEGVIPVHVVKPLIREDTLLVCVLAVNNETGAINRVNEMAKEAHKKGALMLSDCTQLLPMGGECIQLGTRYPDVDYFSFSTHKIYGPTGCGCLIARETAPLYPFIYGGSQESGLRGGTSNLVGAAATAKALELMQESHKDQYSHLYYHLLWLFYSRLNAEPFLNVEYGQYNIMSINFSKVFGRFNKKTPLAALLAPLGISVSSGSACDALLELEDVPSHVLLAQGIPEEEIINTVRVSFTKYTTTTDLDIFVDKIIQLKEQLVG